MTCRTQSYCSEVLPRPCLPYILHTIKKKRKIAHPILGMFQFYSDVANSIRFHRMLEFCF